MNEIDYLGPMTHAARPSDHKIGSILEDFVCNHRHAEYLAAKYQVDKVMIDVLIDDYRGKKDILQPITLRVLSKV